MTESIISLILELVKSINTKMEAMQVQLNMFAESLQPSLEHTTLVEEVIEPKKKLPKIPKSTKKIELGKVYNYKDGKNKRCNTCDGLISFDDYNEETHPWPTHVDKKGHIIGNGSCPEYDPEE